MAWLQGHDMLAHWWTPQAPQLEEGIQTLKDLADTQGVAMSVREFQPDDLLLLLRSLNALIATGSAQLQIDRTEQLWVLSHTERMARDQIDILQRIVVQYPELGIRLAFFSQVSESPTAVPGMHLAPIHRMGEDQAWPMKEATTVPAEAGKRGRPWFMLAAVVLAAMGGWWMRELAGPIPRTPAVAVQPPPAEPPASEPAEPASAPVAPGAAAVGAASEAASEARTPSAPKAPAATAPVSASRRWLLSLPQDSLLVVHAELDSVRAAESFRSSGQPVLANARIVLAEAGAHREERYLVVTAPFRSAERAQSYIQRLPWKARARPVTREALLKQVPR